MKKKVSSQNEKSKKKSTMKTNQTSQIIDKKCHIYLPRSRRLAALFCWEALPPSCW